MIQNNTKLYNVSASQLPKKQGFLEYLPSSDESWNKKNLEESIISTIKAITSIEKLDIIFDLENADFSQINQNSFLEKKISLPNIDRKNISQTRGFADLAALYLKFHNTKIHQQSLPNKQSQKLFDDLEKFRLINQGCREFKGVFINLEKILAKNLSVINDYSFLPFLLLDIPKKTPNHPTQNSEAFEQNHLEQCYKNGFAPEPTDLENLTRNYKKITKKDLLEKIDQISKLVNDQQKFAVKALELIDFLNNQQEKNNKNQDEEKSIPKNLESGPNQNNQENVEQEIKIEKSTSKPQNEKTEETKTFKQSDREVFGDTIVEDLSDNKNNIKFVFEYKVFTKKFDQIVLANDLSSAKELDNLRNQLDLKLEKLARISKQLTAKLKRKLLARKQIFFEFNKEDGLLDRKKISQIISKPSSCNNYLSIIEDDYQNTVLSILLDNSGSMRGSPIVMAAMAAEIIAKIFEGFGIKTEILGFTTSDWRGGKSRKLWEQEGKPKNPGRISDLRHIIYKNANQSFKKSKKNLALMLKDGVLKENIDGEALIWASQRLKSRSEKRKILLVISDGTPVDDSTNSNNEFDILNNHLHQTIQRLEKHSKIEIAAIGIGHNVGDFYHNSITVKNIEELGDIMINKICEII